MKKIAQRRKMLNKLREKTNIKGRILEKLNPEFAEIMQNIRDTDSKIREYANTIKASARNARSAASRRDYLSTAQYLTEFHDASKHISTALDTLKIKTNTKHYDFLINQLDEDKKSKLFNYDPNRIIKLENLNNQIEIYAGPMEWLSDKWFNISDPIAASFHNIFTKPGIAMRALEHLFATPFLRALKINSISMLDKTEAFLDYLLKAFKNLATALAVRDVNSYMEEATNFVKKFGNYNRSFVNYYTKNIEPIKQRHSQIEEEAKKLEEAELARRQKLKEEEEAKAQQVAAKQQEELSDFFAGKQTKQEDASKQVPLKYFEVPLEKDKLVNELSTPKSPLPPTPNSSPSMLTPPASKYQPANKTMPASMPPLPTDVDKLPVNDNDEEGKKTALYKKITTFMKLAQVVDEEQDPDEIPIVVPPNLSATKIEMIPDGNVDKFYSDIPALAKISAEAIRVTPATAAHISGIFLKRLGDANIDVFDFGPEFNAKIIDAIRTAITHGRVLTSQRAPDELNPRDKILTIYVSFNLKDVSQNLPQHRITLNTLCRLSASNGSLTLRTIEKHFKIRG